MGAEKSLPLIQDHLCLRVAALDFRSRDAFGDGDASQVFVTVNNPEPLLVQAKDVTWTSRAIARD